MTEFILCDVRGPVMELRLNRPDKKNALTHEMYAALSERLDEAERDDDVLVVTVTGSGGAFTSGNDLRDFQEAPPVGSDKPVYRFQRTIARFPKILVAGVAGPAVGIGTTMLLHCDLVVAAPSAQFHLPFVDLGLIPEAASTLLLPALIGPQRTARHLILAEPFDASTALAYGIVGEIVEEAALEGRVRELALKVAAKPPEAVRLSKRLIREEREPVIDRIDKESELFARRLHSPEAAEAFRAFFEKRAPDFGRSSAE